MGSAQTYGKCPILSIFSRLGPFPQIFGQVKEWLILELCEMIKVPTHIVACPMVFLFWRIEDLRIAESYVKSFSSMFDSGGPLPHDFRQVQAEIMPYFIKIKRVYFIVTRLIVFAFAVGQEQC